jgi:hypothetical protein
VTTIAECPSKISSLIRSTPETRGRKTGLPERLTGGWNGGRQEVAFYAKIAAATPPGILPRCFEAEWDEKTNDWRLLLEDLGDSHKIVTTWPLPPTFSECETILRARARFHAHWWDDPRLGKSIGSWGDAKAVDQFLRRLASKVAEFEDRLGDRLPAARKDLYKLLLDRAPRLVKTHRQPARGDDRSWRRTCVELFLAARRRKRCAAVRLG